MSVFDWIENAVTGNLTQDQLNEIKARTASDVAKASRGAPQAVIDERVRQAQQEIDGFVRASDAHPDQGGFRLPGLGTVGSAPFLAKVNSIVKVLWAVAIVALILFVITKIGGIKGIGRAAKQVRGE